MARKAYVVFIGRCPSVYNSWVECQEQVNGYPGCSYSSFPSREETERAWLDWNNGGGGGRRVVVLALPAANHAFPHLVDHPGIQNMEGNPVAPMGGNAINAGDEATCSNEADTGNVVTILCGAALLFVIMFYLFFL